MSQNLLNVVIFTIAPDLDKHYNYVHKQKGFDKLKYNGQQTALSGQRPSRSGESSELRTDTFHTWNGVIKHA